jgi:hypothetical protein
VVTVVGESFRDRESCTLLRKKSSVEGRLERSYSKTSHPCKLNTGSALKTDAIKGHFNCERSTISFQLPRVHFTFATPPSFPSSSSFLLLSPTRTVCPFLQHFFLGLSWDTLIIQLILGYLMPGPSSEKQQQSEGNLPRMASGGARYLRYILFAFFVSCIIAA